VEGRDATQEELKSFLSKDKNILIMYFIS